MPEADVVDLPVAELLPETFAPYGVVSAPMEDGAPANPHEAALELGHGVPRFYTMRLPNRGLVVGRITRHRRVTQVLASCGGTPWLIAVAPPPELDSEQAEPALADIKAFRIPAEVAIMLRRGAWHAGPLFETEQASFFNLELNDTNVTDHWNCDLVKRYGVRLRLVG